MAILFFYSFLEFLCNVARAQSMHVKHDKSVNTLHTIASGYVLIGNQRNNKTYSELWHQDKLKKESTTKITNYQTTKKFNTAKEMLEIIFFLFRFAAQTNVPWHGQK